MAGVPGTASAIFGAVKDVGANVIMISQVSSPSDICSILKMLLSNLKGTTNIGLVYCRLVVSILCALLCLKRK